MSLESKAQIKAADLTLPELNRGIVTVSAEKVPVPPAVTTGRISPVNSGLSL
jgi:hypothetical protein